MHAQLLQHHTGETVLPYETAVLVFCLFVFLATRLDLFQGYLQILDGEARRQRLFQFVCLLSIGHAERVQILATPNLEFGHRLRLLDLDGLGILPPGSQEEILDLADLLGHLVLMCWQRAAGYTVVYTAVYSY